MKKLILLSFVVLLTAMAFTSCKEETKSLNLSVPPVSILTAPAIDTSVTLAPATGASIVFKWAASPTPDLVLYEVAFDKAGGDFSNPVYKVLSDGNGVQPQATISQKQLNTIASTAGIASLSTGSLQWAVIVSKSSNAKLSTTNRAIQVTRPAGFAILPDSLYLTGTATEQGAVASKAIHFKKISDGVFELYTSLQAGTYSLVDNRGAAPTVYSIKNSKGVIAGGSTTVTGSTKVYRLSIDLGNAVATLTQIVSVGFWSGDADGIWFTMPYIGNSQWERDDWPLVIPQESWGAESRSKYQFNVMDSQGNASVEWFGSKNSDNSDPTLTTPLSYWYMFPCDGSQWNYCFKIVPSYTGHNVNVNVNFNPALDYYINTITPQ